MKFIPFDSRDREYRSIIGAASEGDIIEFKVLLHNDARPEAVYMIISNITDLHPTEPKYIKMPFYKHYDENYNWFRTEFVAAEGIYSYMFCFDSPWGRQTIMRQRLGEGIICADGSNWQLTVTEKDFKTPENLAGGIIYQIFPDRFFASGKEKKNVPYGRYMQTDWYAQPEYRQNGDVKCLCNDFYGGDLEGIRLKLPYLKSLGVTILYLNPIFEAASNHRYNTADYMKIDPLLGDSEDFRRLCSAAHKVGISVILDGVFSHTGDDSVYFNKYRRYDSVGAYNSWESPYREWFKFNRWPDDYAAWWGVPSLPEVNEANEAYLDFITGDNGVLKHWMKLGADGWRLDVADELPDVFLDRLRAAVKSENKNALIIGEVWEDATNKISYSARRRYLRGRQFDSVMNYPFADAILKFVSGGDAFRFMDTVIEICDNYPKQCLDILMNHIGTHDTARAITALAGDRNCGDRAWQAVHEISGERLAYAKKLLCLAAVLQYTLPGIPSLYYGDEAGMQGYGDPFCRVAYVWGREDNELIEFYRALGNFRINSTVFRHGDIEPIFAGLGYLVYKRTDADSEVLVAVNRWQDEERIFVGKEWDGAEALFGAPTVNGNLAIGGIDCVVLKRKK